MKSYSSREIIRILKANKWYLVGIEGDHHQFKHPTRKGKATVRHPVKDISPQEIKSISKQSWLRF